MRLERKVEADKIKKKFLVFKKSSLAGLTLLELLITLALISILLGAIWLVFNSGTRAFYNQWTRIGIKGEVGRGFFSMSQELRQATSIVSATQTALTFTLDSDSNGVDETLQYTWSGTAGTPLNRVSVSPTPSFTIPVVKSVNNLAFSYYDASNNLLSFPVPISQVKLVAIDLTAADRDETFNLRSKERLRSL